MDVSNLSDPDYGVRFGEVWIKQYGRTQLWMDHNDGRYVVIDESDVAQAIEALFEQRRASVTAKESALRAAVTQNVTLSTKGDDNAPV